MERQGLRKKYKIKKVWRNTDQQKAQRAPTKIGIFTEQNEHDSPEQRNNRQVQNVGFAGICKWPDRGGKNVLEIAGIAIDTGSEGNIAAALARKSGKYRNNLRQECIQ